MVIAGVVCLCLAVLIGGSGLWTLSRTPGTDVTTQVLRAVAPTQLAAAVMLAAGGAVALAVPAQTGLLVLIVCVLGAIGTVAAGSWQGARYAARKETAAGCASGGCSGCTQVCR